MRDLSKAELQNMLFDTLDYLEPLLDELEPLDRAHVERIKDMSGWKTAVDALAPLPADNGRAE